MKSGFRKQARLAVRLEISPTACIGVDTGNRCQVEYDDGLAKLDNRAPAIDQEGTQETLSKLEIGR
jgi:hypothetical protein